jgi:hypothetical protein
MKRTVKTLFGLAACSALMFSAGSIADESGQTVAQRCVDTQLIRNTHILDDQNILFYMRDGKIYHNHLSHACPGLRHYPFMYSIPMHRLCNVDIITVLEDHGFGFERGASCGLGDFTPITKEAAEQMKKTASGKHGG